MIELRTRGGACLHSTAYSPARRSCEQPTLRRRERKGGRHSGAGHHLNDGLSSTYVLLSSSSYLGRRDDVSDDLQACDIGLGGCSPLQGPLSHQARHVRLGHYAITARLQTLDADALALFLDLVLEVGRPAVVARAVTAPQSRRLRIDLRRGVVQAADRTGELGFRGGRWR